MKMDLFCSKDELRPVMQHVKVTKKHIVATNAHILGVVPTKQFFDEDFIAQIPEEGILIHKDDWKEINRYDFYNWKSEGVIRLISGKSKVRDRLIEVSPESKIGRYPEWESVLPELDESCQLNKIGLNAEYLATIQKAFGWEGCKLAFTGQSRAIYVHNYVGSEVYAIIMPLLLK